MAVKVFSPAFDGIVKFKKISNPYTYYIYSGHRCIGALNCYVPANFRVKRLPRVSVATPNKSNLIDVVLLLWSKQVVEQYFTLNNATMCILFHTVCGNQCQNE